METVFEVYEDMLATQLLEGLPDDFWKPSKEAVDDVRKEFMDKMLETPKDLKSFHKSFGQSVRERALQMARQVDDWHNEGRYKWDKGTMVHSLKTGKTYEITGHSVGGSSKNRYPVYTYKHGQEGVTDQWERGTFIADKAHESKDLKKIS